MDQLQRPEGQGTPVEQLVEVWNWPEPEERRAALDRLCRLDFTYHDPHAPAPVQGREKFAAFLSRFQERVPYSLELIGGVDTYRQMFRCRWRLWQASTQQQLSRGQFFGAVDDDGLIASLTSFVDRAGL